MMTKWLRIVFLGCLAAILIQCSPTDTVLSPVESSIPVINNMSEQETQAESAIPSPANAMSEPQIPPTDSPTIDPGLQNLVDQAKADLAQRLSIPLTEISLVEARDVVWPDASLGCPQPGMKYKQVPEDGALIVLKVGEAIYEYHIGGSRGLFLCEMLYKDPSAPAKLDILNLTPSSKDKDGSSPTMPDNGIPPGEDQ
jgi:hypothetical protein